MADPTEVKGPAGLYLPARRHGSLLYVSSVDAASSAFELPVGIVGKNVGIAEARDHAARCAVNLLSIIERETGSLSAVDCIVQVRGTIRCIADFVDHPKVLDGCSEKLIEVLGEWGKHARTVMGMASQPGGTTVEIEAIVALKQDSGSGRGSSA